MGGWWMWTAWVNLNDSLLGCWARRWGAQGGAARGSAKA